MFQANLENVSEIERLFDQVEKHFGRIDGLVNNAGRFTRFDPLEITEADWDFIHDVNLKATFFCCQQAAKRMLAGDGGRIVNISSLGGMRPWARPRALLRVQSRRHHADARSRQSLRAKNNSELGRARRDSVWRARRTDQRLICKTPAQRAGTAEEIADAVVYFLTATNFITGQVLAVDGGLSQK